MKYKFKYSPNNPQRDFHEDVKSQLLHLSMGFGGGKTYALCKKTIQLSLINKNIPGGLVVPDFKDFKRDVLPEMENILERAKVPYRYHQTDHYFKFPWTRAKVYVASAEKSLRGPNWGWATINELTLMPLMRYKEVMGRVRLKHSVLPQIASCGTPEGFASEYYDYMIETPPTKLRIIYGSTDDNIENLNEHYIPLLEDSYDKVMIETYRKGLWVNMTGSRFYYSFDPRKAFDKTLVREPGMQVHCSMDFNVDPFCATLWHCDGFNLFGFDQVELKGNEGYSTENMIQALMKRGYGPNTTIIYPDPAGNARSTKGKPDVQVLRAAGYEVRVKAAAPSFRARQLNVNNILDKSRLKLNPDVCKGIKKDFEGVEQDVITLEKRKNNPNLTHFSDGVDYMCDILFPFSGNPKATTVVKHR